MPLLQDNHTNYLVIEYKGEESQRFVHLVKHLFKSLEIIHYSLYEGKDKERIQVFIHVEQMNLEDADKQLTHISTALKTKMNKNWKCLPKFSLPESYNIVTLPYI